ncbi:probable glycosyltransferase At3g07620 [Populus trichocarpa]|uniref:Exostosin GT47 domain-containing protein n=3 Tax=Populus trichocarpa TaxID=3694 RepID=A0A2K1ZT19_POPTR|nr:probable glycosyltransferase At3g07620 [Populus trichocarpa]|eukprot:XP_002309856.3 probable glycosyltransferase At3g07620 [Populus trichocarpa]
MKNLKRGGLACFFVIVSICFFIYPPGFPPFQGSFQAYAQEAGFFGEVFHVPEAFDPDYEEMERKFKIFVYPHNTSSCSNPRTLDGEYGNEGLFYLNLNLSRFLTKDPEKAHLFLIPISCHSLPAGRSEDERAIAVEDFVKSLISKYPYWNRTLGADHFFVTCVDINVTATARIANLMKNSIKVMCTPSYNDEYVPHKDVSLPQRVPPLALTPAGNNITNRITLAFWRGLNNSDIRQKLLEAWENDLELFIQKGRKPSLEQGDLVHHEAFNNSKYCICPGGPELDRTIALAIHYGCVPVIMSDYYDLPFKDILDWRKFSIILEESQVYYLREHLKEMLEHEYRAMQTNTVMVRKHFQWNLVPAKYDAFHMTMYDLWLRNHFTKYY